MNPLLYTILIGAVAGWLAGFFVKGVGFGIIGNIIIGILGSFVGGGLRRFLWKNNGRSNTDFGSWCSRFVISYWFGAEIKLMKKIRFWMLIVDVQNLFFR